MAKIADQLVKKWLAADTPDREELLETNLLVTYLEDRLYDSYEPNQFERFSMFLDKWLSNVDADDDKKTLYRLLGELFFLGRQEFESLYRAAFQGPITRWIIDEEKLSFGEAEFDAKLDAAVSDTWFCPMTDSMRINAFLKVNGLVGDTYRPEWWSLARFGDPTKIKDYIGKRRIRRLVLLEDFVGTGEQMETVLRFARSVDAALPILACPLVVCPVGVQTGEQLSMEYNVNVQPILPLAKDQFIRLTPAEGEKALFPLVRDLIKRTCVRVQCAGELSHGYKGTGAIVVLYSNCPDNTLPIVHVSNDTWNPLFPRIRRG